MQEPWAGLAGLQDSNDLGLMLITKIIIIIDFII
jgi:hypothetical protein